MMRDSLEYADEFLRRMGERLACQWCKHPDKQIYHVGLCRPCYNIRAKINRYHKRVEEYKKKMCGEVSSELAFRYRAALDDETLRYRVALGEEKDAKEEGEVYGRVYTEDISGINLEAEFRKMSNWFVHQDLYYGYVDLFNSTFTAGQKRLLYYVISKLSRAYLRRTRLLRAVRSPLAQVSELNP